MLSAQKAPAAAAACFWWYWENLLSLKGKFMAKVYSLILPWGQKCLETHNAVLWIMRSFSISSFNPINYHSLVWPWVYMNPSFQKFHHRKFKNKVFLACWRSGRVTRSTLCNYLQGYSTASVHSHQYLILSGQVLQPLEGGLLWGDEACQTIVLTLFKQEHSNKWYFFPQHLGTLLVKRNQHLEDVLDQYYFEEESCSVIDSTSLSR